MFTEHHQYHNRQGILVGEPCLVALGDTASFKRMNVFLMSILDFKKKEYLLRMNILDFKKLIFVLNEYSVFSLN